MNYAWDAEDRLVGITYVGVSGKATAFTYDGLGRRVTITSTPAGGGGTVTTTYIWCGDQPCQARNSSNAVIKGYYAEGEFELGSPGIPYYYAPDNIGSVRRVFSASSSPTYDYDSYGVLLQATAPVTDFNYAGTFYNADSGLYLAVDRIYKPAIGRWLSRDPVGEAGDPFGNLYPYVSNDPLNLVDPDGDCGPVCLGIAVGAAAAAMAAWEYESFKHNSQPPELPAWPAPPPPQGPVCTGGPAGCPSGAPCFQNRPTYSQNPRAPEPKDLDMPVYFPPGTGAAPL